MLKSNKFWDLVILTLLFHILRYIRKPQGGALQGQNRTDDPFPVAGLPVAAGAARRRQPPQLELRSGQPVEPVGGAGASGRQPLGGYLLVSHRSEQRAAGGDRRGGQPVLVGQYDTFGKLQGQTVAGAAKRQGAQYQQPLRYAGQYGTTKAACTTTCSATTNPRWGVSPRRIR